MKKIISSIYASLILASISIITIIYSNLNNQKILNQNEESQFIQLRFKDSKESIFHLIDFIQNTCTIYKELKDLNNDKINENNLLSPREFLVMQYVTIITNKKLLNKLPLYVKSKIELEFNERVNYKWEESANETIKRIDNYLSPMTQLFNCMNTYNNFISNFKQDSNYEYNKTILKSYISSNISEEELLSLFINILNEITNTKLEDLILKDKQINSYRIPDDSFEKFLKE